MKNVKKIIAATLVGAMILPLAGCAKKIERVKSRDFEAAIEEVFDDDEYGSYGGSTVVYADNYEIMFMTLDDDDEARDDWEDFLDEFDDMMDDDDFDGRTRRVDRGEYGYVLLDGENDSRDFADGSDYLYGGIYYVEDELIVVLTTKDKDSYREDVDTILNALGFPHL